MPPLQSVRVICPLYPLNFYPQFWWQHLKLMGFQILLLHVIVDFWFLSYQYLGSQLQEYLLIIPIRKIWKILALCNSNRHVYEICMIMNNSWSMLLVLLQWAEKKLRVVIQEWQGLQTHLNLMGYLAGSLVKMSSMTSSWR